MIAWQGQHAGGLPGPQQLTAPQIDRQANQADIGLAVRHRLNDITGLKGIDIQLIFEYRPDTLQVPYRRGQQAGPQGIGSRDTQRAALPLGNLARAAVRSEEHTSELQSLMRISYAVFCLKKKKQKRQNTREQITKITIKNKIKKTNKTLIHSHKELH